MLVKLHILKTSMMGLTTSHPSPIFLVYSFHEKSDSTNSNKAKSNKSVVILAIICSQAKSELSKTYESYLKN